MDAEDNPANEPPFDPLTSPAWMFEEDDEILLAPPLEEFFSDVAAARSPGPVAPPPKMDEIISGGYTGWVPIIRAGESLAEAQARAEQTKQLEIDSVEIVEVTEVKVSSTSESVAPESEVKNYGSVPIVDDPDLVSSPSQALDQARKRIAAMRASLQLNLNQVAESFAHPIFTPPATVVAAQQPAAVQQAVTTATQPEAQPVANSTPEITQDISTAPNSSVQDPSARRQSNEPISGTAFTTDGQQNSEPKFEAPQATRFFIPTETQTQPETEVQAAPTDHSLELMIMRDEIKDLRDRLDASQKLIEELMHRLANLAELALKR